MLPTWLSVRGESTSGSFELNVLSNGLLCPLGAGHGFVTRCDGSNFSTLPFTPKDSLKKAVKVE